MRVRVWVDVAPGVGGGGQERGGDSAPRVRSPERPSPLSEPHVRPISRCYKRPGTVLGPKVRIVPSFPARSSVDLARNSEGLRGYGIPGATRGPGCLHGEDAQGNPDRPRGFPRRRDRPPRAPEATCVLAGVGWGRGECNQPLKEENDSRLFFYPLCLSVSLRRKPSILGVPAGRGSILLGSSGPCRLSGTRRSCRGRRSCRPSRGGRRA